MKNLLKNTVVIVVLFITLLGHANSSFNILNDGKRTTLTLNNVKQGDKLWIKDAFGSILYQEKIKTSGEYNRGFDLTELPDGDYFFELDNTLEIKVIPFHVSIHSVIFNKNKEQVEYKTQVSNKDNRVFISKLSLNKEPLKIEVYFENENNDDFGLIHSETIENTQTIKRVIELNKDAKGTYRIVTRTKERTFVNYVQI